MLRALRWVVLLALAWFYAVAAHEHARTVNTVKARGDQSGYLGDAERVYANRHGANPPLLVGERNRMPLYAGYLSLFYDPQMSDPAFFEVAKTWNIRLSLVLLAVLLLVFDRHLPVLVSTNLLLIVSFGYFVFKAGYSQSELLFYVLFFATFLSACYLLEKRDARHRLALGGLTGVLAGLAHLTKAGVLPLVGILLGVCGVREIVLFARGRSAVRSLVWHASATALVAVCMLAVIAPYLVNSKRVYGQYFYNVNTTFYVWYDNWAQASVGPYAHGDAVGWPTQPDDQLMSASKYWQTHTLGQIADRLEGGFADMVVRSYTTFWYLKYVVLYSVFAGALVMANRKAFAGLLREQAALAWFLGLYAVVYALAIAFYAPTSGTGTTRFLLADMLPLLFVLSAFFVRRPFADTRWTLGGTTVTTAHFHILVAATMALDLCFTIWPRLMTTYGGF